MIFLKIIIGIENLIGIFLLTNIVFHVENQINSYLHKIKFDLNCFALFFS